MAKMVGAITYQGHWLITNQRQQDYQVEVHFSNLLDDSTVHFHFNTDYSHPIGEDNGVFLFDVPGLPAGCRDNRESKLQISPLYVIVKQK